MEDTDYSALLDNLDDDSPKGFTIDDLREHLERHEERSIVIMGPGGVGAAIADIISELHGPIIIAIDEKTTSSKNNIPDFGSVNELIRQIQENMVERLEYEEYLKMCDYERNYDDKPELTIIVPHLKHDGANYSLSPKAFREIEYSET